MKNHVFTGLRKLKIGRAVGAQILLALVGLGVFCMSMRNNQVVVAATPPPSKIVCQYQPGLGSPCPAFP
ncbi:MAG: hypothetical protein WAM71_16660, partial [Candidatus Korobacteraceae bacterium]